MAASTWRAAFLLAVVLFLSVCSRADASAAAAAAAAAEDGAEEEEEVNTEKIIFFE